MQSVSLLTNPTICPPGESCFQTVLNDLKYLLSFFGIFRVPVIVLNIRVVLVKEVPGQRESQDISCLIPADVSRLCHERPILFEGWNLRRLTLSSRLPCHVFYIRNTNQLGVVPLGIERHLMFWVHFQEVSGQLFSFTQIHFNIFGINLGKAVSHQSLFRIFMFQSFLW